MGMYYVIISIFITLFFSKQITDVSCFGRHRDQKCTKRKYCLTYSFWLIFWLVLCLMMGSASGVDHTFDRILDTYWLYSGEFDYRQETSKRAEPNYKKEDDFTLTFYIRRNEKHIEDLLEQIVKENNSIYKLYQFSEIEVIYEMKGVYSICDEGVVYAKVIVENEGLLKKVSYQWSRAKLEQRIGG